MREGLKIIDYLFDIIDDYERGLRDEAICKIKNPGKYMKEMP